MRGCTDEYNVHDKKIVHRDLKPENIFINEDKIIKIGDFSISKQLKIYFIFKCHYTFKNIHF